MYRGRRSDDSRCFDCGRSAAAEPGSAPPVAYECDATAEMGNWDDQYFDEEPPLCEVADESFTLCLKVGEFEIRTPSVDLYAAYIVGLYLGTGTSASVGKCFKPVPRLFWLCYGKGANSLGVYDAVTAAKGLVDGMRVPYASRTIDRCESR